MKKAVIPYLLSLLLMASFISQSSSLNDDENPLPTNLSSFVNN